MAAERELVFLDASVLVAASHSPSGGSAVAMEACTGLRFRAAVSLQVLAEARVNIAEKLADADLVRFYRQLADLDPLIAAAPSAATLASCISPTSEKDAHVLAAALDCGAVHLLTLDSRHLLNQRVLNAGLPLAVLTPGDFLEGVVRIGDDGS